MPRIRLDAFQLKVIALSLMIAEHVGRFLGPYLPGGLPLPLVYAGRVVFPIFLFLVVESVFNTSDRRRYLMRLWSAAAIMAAGNFAVGLAVQRIWPAEPFNPLDVNIFLTLALAASFVVLAERGRRTPGMLGVGVMGAAALTATGMMLAEGSALALGLTLIFYVLRDNRQAVVIGYSAFSLLIGALLFVSEGLKSFWAQGYQWAMVAAAPLIAVYSGERGRPVKWFFYALYPLHLWLLYLLSYATGGAGVPGP